MAAYEELSPIRSRLAALRGRIATALVLDGAARVAGALLAAIAVSFVLDRVFKLEIAARAVLLLAGLGLIGFVFWRFLLRRLRTIPGEAPLAIAVERQFPELKDRLISALQLSRVEDPEHYGMSPQLVEDAVEEALEPARKIRFGEVLATARTARIAALGLLALVLLAVGASADPESAGIWFRRNVLLANERWPQKTYLELDEERFRDGVARVVRGSDFVVTARSTGEIDPDKVFLYFEDSEGVKGRVMMTSNPQARLYRHEFEEIGFPIRFHLEGGDEVTKEYSIELMEPPEVTELVVTVAFPDYAGRDPVEIDISSGDPEVLRGGSISFAGKSSKPLESAQIVIGELESASFSAQVERGATAFRFENWQPREDALVGIRLRDTDGLSNPTLAPRFPVRVVPDRAPRVRLTKRGIGTMVVEGAVVPCLVRIRDDVRAVKGRIEIKMAAGDREGTEPFEIELPEEALAGEEPSVEILQPVEISTLEVEPGTFLTFKAFATDNAPEAQVGESDPITVKVVTYEQLVNELIRRQQEQRQLFEELIAKEKRLRDRFRDLRDSPPDAPSEIALHLEGEAQEQRGIARRVRGIERAMTQILDEMLNNRISDVSRITQLRNQVVKGMERLRLRVMHDHAADLDRYARRAAEISLTGEEGAEIDAGYGRVLAAMRQVLAHMQKIESFTEIVERVRGLLKLHEEVKEETRRKYEAELREIFGEDKVDGD
jgi:hypothetical protein